jgi:hypothetical protein
LVAVLAFVEDVPVFLEFVAIALSSSPSDTLEDAFRRGVEFYRFWVRSPLFFHNINWFRASPYWWKMVFDQKNPTTPPV